MSNQKAKTRGLRFTRHFTHEGQDPFDQFEYELRSSVIRNPGGDVVFEMKEVEVHRQWSQIATDIIAQKYFRKAGVASRVKKFVENGVPSWLWRWGPGAAAR
jgi:ribonucleoside-diphosphate reductase alpha chain